MSDSLSHDLENMSEFDKIALEIDDLYSEARHWADGEPIANQEQHDAVELIHDTLRDLGNTADELRKAEVKPFDDCKAAVQAKYHPLIGNTKAGKGKVVLGKEALNKVLADWRDKERRRKEAEAEKARQEAEAEALKAQEAMQASAGNLEAREEAERIVQQAEIAAQDAERMTKAATTGTGLRTYYHPEIEDWNAAIRHYWGTRRHRFLDLVLELAKEDFRSGNRKIPGIKAVEDRKAV